MKLWKRRGHHNSDDEGLSDRAAYSMCKRKRKLKSSEAAKLAHRFGQRKYLCPVCHGWHLTKTRKR
ncbi:hypothetical protein MAC3UK_0013 [Bdellovibrio phage MAC3UK]|nr:hypothetical protein MAC3UK_0013 [Bdellovibrio phage MAC3UK]